MQQLAFGTGIYTNSLFHMLFFPCAVIVDIKTITFYNNLHGAVITLIKFIAYKFFYLLNPFVAKINPFVKPV